MRAVQVGQLAISAAEQRACPQPYEAVMVYVTF